MPRSDPTFSSSDVVRIYLNNLTRAEQVDVLCFFKLQVDFTEGFFGQRVITQRMVAQMVGSLSTFFGPAGQVFNLFLDMAQIFLQFQELNACLRRAQTFGSSITRRVPGLVEAVRDMAEEERRHQPEGR